MRIRPWTWWLPAGLCAAALALVLPALALAVLNRHAPGVWAIADPFWIIGGIAYSLVGWLLAARRPANALGWVFLAIGLLLGAAALTAHWAVYALETAPGGRGGAHALWASVGLAMTAGLPIPLVLFPTGRLESRWARLVAGVSAADAVWFVLILLSGPIIAPGFPALYEQTPNQLAVIPWRVGDPGVAIILLNLCLLAAIVLLLARFRAARGLVRQQYMWVVLAMALVVAANLADVVARASGSGA